MEIVFGLDCCPANPVSYTHLDSNQKTVEVPVSLDINDRATEKGISSRNVIVKQSKAALDILNENKPDRIITLGGECSVSVVPFTYLAARYPNDVDVYKRQRDAWFTALSCNISPME